MNNSPETMPANSDAIKPPLTTRQRWKRYCLKLAFSLFVALIALKIGDWAIGRLRHTSERHWLRLVPYSAERHTSTEFDYVFHTNSLGFRGPDIPFEKPQGTRRIVVLGDSFVSGVGVADEDVFTQKLQNLFEKQSSKTEIINLGRTGSSTIREYDLYRKYGRKYQPDVVILVFFLGNDLAEINEEMTAEELANWKPSGFLRSTAYTLYPNLYLELAMRKKPAEPKSRTQSELVKLVESEARRRGLDTNWAVKRLRKIPKSVRTATCDGTFPLVRLMHACLDPTRYERSLSPNDDEFNKSWPRVTHHLNLLLEAVREDGAVLRILALPESVQVDDAAVAFNRKLGFVVRDEWRTGTCRTERALHSWARKHQIGYLNLTDIFRGSPESIYHIWDSHLNAKGHELTAKELFNWLQKSKFLK
ncbi:MAG: hypothetical protein Tsb009_18270 [Planctomycetaceae bacterium]